VTGWSWWG